MSQPSPYTPGVVARDVPGRATQLAFFRERAEYIGLLSGFSGRVTVYHAARGIGKTSLLRSAQRIFRANKIQTVWITADENEPLIETVLSEIQNTLPATHKARKVIHDALESVTVSVGTSGTGVKATLKPTAIATSKAKVFQRALQTTTEALSESGERGLVILIDEIQSADPQSIRTLAHAWQEMASLDPPPPAGIFAAGLPGSQEIINKAVTFSERYNFVPLPDLEDSGVAAALVEPSKALGVAWDTEALKLAVQNAQGFPYKVQLIGQAAWFAAGFPAKGATITVDNVVDAMPEVNREMRSLYAARWRAATRKQQQLIAAIAELGGKDVRRDQVAELLGVSTGALSVPRDRLLRAGTIEATDHGLMSFTVPGFTEYVKQVAN